MGGGIRVSKGSSFGRETQRRQGFVVIDVETTGVYLPPSSRVIELAAIKWRAGQLEGQIGALINPGVPVPEEIVRLTGITQAMVSGGQPIWGVLRALSTMFDDGSVLVAHNADFEMRHLQFLYEHTNITWNPRVLCTQRLAKRLLPEARSYGLEALCAHLGIAHVGAHRASADARVTVQLMEQLFDRARRLGVTTTSQLLALGR